MYKSIWTRAVLAVFAVVGTIFLYYSVVIETDQLLVKDYSIHLRNWSGALNNYKIVVLSDLHVGSFHIDENKVKRIIDDANNQHADLILLLGDYVASKKSLNIKCIVKPEVFESELARLRAKDGVFAVIGNHDWWYDKTDVINCLHAAKITVLENESYEITSKEHHFWLVGLNDYMEHYPSLQQAFDKVPANAPVICLSHNPDIFPDLSQQVTLTLAGHTHGGQVSLPFIGPLIVPSKYHARYAQGIKTEDGKTLFVSPGIGTSILPIRFNVPPEISVLHLFNDDSARSLSTPSIQ